MRTYARFVLLGLALAFAGHMITTPAQARSLNGCYNQQNDNEGSDHGNGHDAFCDEYGFD